VRVTPMMENNTSRDKAAHPRLLFYGWATLRGLLSRMRELPPKALGIHADTNAGKAISGHRIIPMWRAVQVGRSDDYLHRLIEKGFRVAVCGSRWRGPGAGRRPACKQGAWCGRGRGYGWVDTGAR